MSGYKIVKRERICASPPRGMSQEWIEYQVVRGRKIVSRHGTKEEAEKAAANILRPKD